MNTTGRTNAPGFFPHNARGGATHSPRDGPTGHPRELAALAVLILVTLGLGLFLTVRYFSPREPAPVPAGTVATTIAVPNLTATYGDTRIDLHANVAGDGATIGTGTVAVAILLDGQPIAVPTSTGVVDGVAATNVALPAGLAAGTYTVEVTYGGEGAFAASRTTTQLVIAPASAAVTLATVGLSRTYDGSPQAAVAATDPAGLSVALTYSRDGVTIAAPIAAGTYVVEATVADPNYRGTARGTLVIDRAMPAITWQAPPAITYGTPLGAAQFGATASVAGAYAYTPPLGTILPSGTDQALTTTFTPSDTANYLTATARVPIAVLKAPLAVAAANQTRAYGSANPPLTADIRGFVNGENAAVLGGTPQLVTEAVASSTVGTYPITIAGGELTAANYAITFAPGLLAVVPAPLNIAVDDAARVYGAPDPTLTGTIVGLVNGDSVVATYQAGAQVGSPVGTYPINAALADPHSTLGNYAVAITPGTLTISAAGSVATVAPLTAHEGDVVSFDARVAAGNPSVIVVDEGTATFSIMRGDKAVLTSGPVAVQAGTASAEVSLWGLDSGEYTLAVAYGDAANFIGSDGATTFTLLNTAPTATFAIPVGPIPEGNGFTIALLAPSDPSAADQAAGFTYAFDRGDGQWFTPPAGLGHATCFASNDPGQTVRARITDRDGASTVYTLTVAVANTAPVARPIVGPVGPVAYGTVVAVQTTFYDPGTLDRHTATWDWGDGTTTSAALAEVGGNGTVAGEHRYASGGVYAISVTIADERGDSSRIADQFVVIDDATQVVAVGSVSFTSPAGAVIARPVDSGTATLGFAAGYAAGSTALRFRVSDLDFAGVYAAWGPHDNGYVQLEATGTLNGAGNYRLVLAARDGRLPNGEGDRVRITIWNRASGALVYDSQPGTATDDAPASVIETGDIVIRGLLPGYPQPVTIGPHGEIIGLLEH